MVIDRLHTLSLKFSFKIEWCVHVTVSPDEIKMIVFNKGISKGLKGMIPRGGHDCPISIAGDSEE